MRTGISAAWLRSAFMEGRRRSSYTHPRIGGSRLTADHGLQGRQGSILMRWVPAEIWQHVEGEVAPRVAVLLDLLEHDDPRARREAREALSG